MTRSPLLPLFLTVFVDVLGLTLVIPLLPYYAEHFGASPTVVGLLTASYSACQLVSGPVLGAISDRVGRKRTLLLSQCGTLLGFAVLGGAQSLWMLFLGRIIDGCTAGNLTIAQAYISDVTRPENRTRAFGLIGIAFGLGFLLGPAASGFLAHRYGFSAPAIAAACLSALSILFTATLLPDIQKPADAPRRTLSFGGFVAVPLVRLRLLQFFSFILCFSTLIGGVPLFLERRFHYNVEQTGYVFAFSGLIGALAQGGLGRLARALGEEKLALLGFLAAAVSHAALGWVASLPALLAVITLSSLGTSVVRPALTTLITRSVAPDQQGAALGMNQSLACVAQMTGPVLAGALIQREQLALFGIASASFAAVGALLLLLNPRAQAEAAAG